MFLDKLPPFARMIFGALTGIILGIVFGLLFGLLIDWIAIMIIKASQCSDTKGVCDLAGEGASGPPYGVAAFLGMGAGAVIGSIMGAVTANKK